MSIIPKNRNRTYVFIISLVTFLKFLTYQICSLWEERSTKYAVRARNKLKYINSRHLQSYKYQSSLIIIFYIVIEMIKL